MVFKIVVPVIFKLPVIVALPPTTRLFVSDRLFDVTLFVNEPLPVTASPANVPVCVTPV